MPLKYNNGTAVFNFDVTNDVGGNSVIQRAIALRSSGPPSRQGSLSPLLRDKAVAYVGVGGGVFTPQLANTKSLVPINWRVVF